MNHLARCLLIGVAGVLVIACGGTTPSDNISDPTTSIATTVAEDTAVIDSSAGSPTGAIAQAVASVPLSLPVSNQFENFDITEASGVQRSLSLPGVYYVHNDSGASATLYVTDTTGQSLGQLQLSGVQATDWEAIAGVRLSGQPHIVVADIGNNDRNRGDLNLQVIEEPDFSDLPINFNLSVESTQIGISYADGLSYDAEAVFIDSDNDAVVVVTKNLSDTTAQSVWKGSLASGLSDGAMVLEYRGLLAMPAKAFVNAVTDIDIHPDGRQLALLVYGLATTGKIFLWQPSVGESTDDALLRMADREVSVPIIGSNRQAEGISFSAQGDAFLIAAEGVSTSTMTLVSF